MFCNNYMTIFCFCTFVVQNTDFVSNLKYSTQGDIRRVLAQIDTQVVSRVISFVWAPYLTLAPSPLLTFSQCLFIRSFQQIYGLFLLEFLFYYKLHFLLYYTLYCLLYSKVSFGFRLFQICFIIYFILHFLIYFRLYFIVQFQLYLRVHFKM